MFQINKADGRATPVPRWTAALEEARIRSRMMCSCVPTDLKRALYLVSS